MDKTEIANKRQAREYVFKMVFEYSFLKRLNEQTYAMCVAALPDDARPYFEATAERVVEHYDEMVALIMTKVKGYSSPERLHRTDLAVMVYAAYELTYRPELPAAVVIKEAVELAKQYGAEKSGAFVNGVLGAIAKDR